MNLITENTEINTSDILLRKAMYLVYGGMCFYTGRHVDFEDMHIDHILSKQKQGKNCISNYVLACGYINLRKSNKYSNKFIELTVELNNLLFVNDVVKEYNNLLLNIGINENMIDIIQFLKVKDYKNYQKKVKFIQYAHKQLKSIKKQKQKQNGGVSSKVAYFFNIEDLESLYQEYNASQNIRDLGVSDLGIILEKSTVGTTESYASGRTKITDFLKEKSVSSNEGRSPSL